MRRRLGLRCEANGNEEHAGTGQCCSTLFKMHQNSVNILLSLGSQLRFAQPDVTEKVEISSSIWWLCVDRSSSCQLSAGTKTYHHFGELTMSFHIHRPFFFVINKCPIPPSHYPRSPQKRGTALFIFFGCTSLGFFWHLLSVFGARVSFSGERKMLSTKVTHDKWKMINHGSAVVAGDDASSFLRQGRKFRARLAPAASSRAGDRVWLACRFFHCLGVTQPFAAKLCSMGNFQVRDRALAEMGRNANAGLKECMKF